MLSMQHIGAIRTKLKREAEASAPQLSLSHRIRASTWASQHKPRNESEPERKRSSLCFEMKALTRSKLKRSHRAPLHGVVGYAERASF